MHNGLMTEERLHTRDFVELENQYGAHNYHPLDVVIERAEGVWVYDIDGKRYLDCLAAYSAVNQGHCHPNSKSFHRASAEGDAHLAGVSQRSAPAFFTKSFT